MSATETAGSSFGANSWLVEEMYEQYRADPDSVGESWREFFEDYRSMTAAAHPELAPQPAPAEPVPAEQAVPTATPAAAPAPAVTPAATATPSSESAPAAAPAPAPMPGQDGELI